MRAYIITKYDVEYGNQSFNWQAEELLNLLLDNDVNVFPASEWESFCRWDIDPTSFREYVEKLKEISIDREDQVHPKWADIDNCDYITYKYMIDVFEDWLNNITDGYVRITWF